MQESPWGNDVGVRRAGSGIRSLYERRSAFLVLALFFFTACSSDSDPRELSRSGSGYAESPDGVEIKYDDFGKGSPALVLVHGWSCDRSYWSGQIEQLSSNNRVITVDLGGHGESGMGRDDWSIASFGADVAAVISTLGLGEVVLVGHSMGGDVIFQAAKRLPGKVSALVMLDTYKKLGNPRTDVEIDQIAAEFEVDFSGVTQKYVRGYFSPDADPALVHWIAADMAAAPQSVAISALRSSFQHARQVPDLIRELEIPVAAINPDDSPTDIESMSEHGVDVVIMPSVGHFLMMEKPNEFNDLLLTTVERLLHADLRTSPEAD